MDYSPPGSSIHGILQARVLEWVAMPPPRCIHVCMCSVVSNSLWPSGLQPASYLCPCGFSRQKYWSGLPHPPPGNLPNPGIEPRFPTLQVDSLPSELPRKTLVYPYYMLNLAIKKNAVSIRYNMDELWKHDVKWKKLVTKDRTFHGFIYVKFLEKANSQRGKVD